MNAINSKIDNRLTSLSLIGPAAVILPILLLIIKASPFYIDLAATSFVCLLICWRYRLRGLILASLLLFLVTSYNFVLRGTQASLWEIGLALSLQLSFVITSLASAELKEAFESVCKVASTASLMEIEEWKRKVSEALLDKEALLKEMERLKSNLLPLQDGIKDKTEKSAMFERLLEMAKTELLEQTAKRRHFEEQYLNLKNAYKAVKADAEEEREILKAQNLILESDVNAAQLGLYEKEKLLEQQMILLMDSKLKMEGLQEKFEFEKDKFGSEIEHSKVEIADLKDKLERQKTFSNETTTELRNLTIQLTAIEEEKEQLLALKEKFQLEKAAANEANEKIHSLNEQLESLIDRLKNLQTEKEDLEKALEAALNEEIPVKEGKELKRVWGLHDQLRHQFNEKCHVLNSTRRQLFLAQEELLTRQKSTSFEEEATYHAYEAHVLELSSIINKLELEIATLEDIIISF